MIWRIGPLCISWGKILMVKHNIIVIEEDFVVRVPRIKEIEDVLELPTPVIKRVPENIEVPVYEIVPVKHQLVQHTYVVAEKNYPIKIERPVPEIVDKVVEIQRLNFQAKEISIPRYKLVQGEENIVIAPAQSIFEITCPCGNTYTTNHTKCLKCGRLTSDNLKDMQK